MESSPVQHGHLVVGGEQGGEQGGGGQGARGERPQAVVRDAQGAKIDRTLGRRSVGQP